VTVKDMILQCLNQMIKARADKIRSGWRTMFGVFTYAAKEKYGIVARISLLTLQSPSSVSVSKTSK
jgi:brefeldin A-inhibited guanine nucleotide-exchange protein